MMKPCTAFLLPLLLASAAPAQVPDGHYVVSSFKTFTAPSTTSHYKGDGGLFFVHPRNPGTPTAVTGLSKALTGTGQTSGNMGASCVVIDPSDGKLIVGEYTTGLNVSVYLHVIELQGAAVKTDRRIKIGSTGSIGGGRIADASLLPNGQVVIATEGISGLFPSRVASVDLVTGKVSRIDVGTGFAGFPNAVVADPSGKVVYIGDYQLNGPGYVYSLPVSASGTPTRLAKFGGSVYSLAIANNGHVLVGIGGLGKNKSLYDLDPVTKKTVLLTRFSGITVALAVERATGNLALNIGASTSAGPRIGVGWLGNANEYLLSTGPSSNWGLVSGIDVNNDPSTYGKGSPGANTYEWQVAPNLGGLPLLGNSKFALELRASPGKPNLSFYYLSSQPGSLQIGPITVLLRLPGLIGPFGIVSNTNMTIPMPIPNNKSFVGIRLYGQSFHFDTKGLAASNGVVFTVL